VLTIHVAAATLSLAGGWVVASTVSRTWGLALVAAGIAVRAGVVPAHCWVTDLFERASLGSALLATTPLVGVYAAARLLAGGAAPAGVLVGLAWVATLSSLYSAAMSLVQTDARRFLSHLLLSFTALALAGIALPERLASIGALYLWASIPLSVTGLGLTLRALEARTGRLPLTGLAGLHAQVPTFAALVLVSGLAAVGFPGTVGFFAIEMLTDAASRTHKPLGIAVVLAAALAGIAVVRAYACLFLGPRHGGNVDLRARPIELAALLVLLALLFGGAVWPGGGLEARTEAAAGLHPAATTRRGTRRGHDRPQPRSSGGRSRRNAAHSSRS
jgi:NADH-quinone oxidoreductase subunit M